ALTAILQHVGDRFEAAAPTLDRYGYRCLVERSRESVRAQVYDPAGRPVCGLALWRDTSSHHDKLAMSFAWPRLETHGMNGWISAAWDPDRQEPVADFSDFTDFATGGGSRMLSAEELFADLWGKIVDHLDRQPR
ncbi:MAG TPA: hypothetical protein VLM05_11270, partial [Mycobacteriales bacterium]|nr:hypothetical protein [Mycobacteriales bacterium]